MNLLLVVKVEIVVQLSELQDNFNCFWFVISREAAMLSSLKNSVAALEDQVRADWVLTSVKTLIKTLLLGKQDDRAVLLQLACLLAEFLYGSLYVTPNVRRIVPIQVDDCLWRGLAAIVNVSC